MTETRPDAVEEKTERKEATVSEVFDNLKRLSSSEQEHREEDANGWLKERVAKLPSPARREIRDYDAWFNALATQGVNINDEVRIRILDRDVSRIESSFIDRRFTMENGERMMNERYGKEKAKELIARVMNRPESRESDLARVARLSFDANGLKAINDLSASHEKGNDYLRRIAEVVADPDGPAAKILKEAGVTEIVPVTGGGDEYSVIVYGDQPLDRQKLDQAVKAYESTVAEIGTDDLVDFKDLDVRLRFLGVPRKDYDRMDQNEKKAVEAGFRQVIPEGFKMFASMSGGVESLTEGVRRAIRDERDTKRLTGQEEYYEEALAKTMGGLWDAADAAMESRKTAYKASLEAPGSSVEERAYAQIFSRNKAEREARKKSETMEGEANRAGEYDYLLKTEDGELDRLEAIKEDLGQEAYDRAELQIHRKYRQQLRAVREKKQG